MGKVYESAECVVARLGKYGGQKAASLNQFLRESPKNAPWPWRNDSAREILHRFCQQRFWSRLWIVKELMLARRIKVQWGDETLPWENIEPMFELAIGADVGSITSATTETNAWSSYLSEYTPSRIYEAHRDQFGALLEFYTLWDLFILYLKAECEDKRDKIYGLRALSPDCCKSSIPVDYSKDVDKVGYMLIYHQLTAHDLTPYKSRLEPDAESYTLVRKTLDCFGLLPKPIADGEGFITLRNRFPTTSECKSPASIIGFRCQYLGAISFAEKPFQKFPSPEPGERHRERYTPFYAVTGTDGVEKYPFEWKIPYDVFDVGDMVYTVNDWEGVVLRREGAELSMRGGVSSLCELSQDYLPSLIFWLEMEGLKALYGFDFKSRILKPLLPKAEKSVGENKRAKSRKVYY
ncbi:hypothetical protein BDZ45DRAFT_479083 [Acephala macrosclerotiorum]|nr:hypothetical protein BDZ45DRAFT_479083 [Acephala macrosclerotiorum]